MRYVFVMFVCLCFARSSDQKSTPDDDSYTAAVLEYQFTKNTSQNLHTYLDYIKQAAEQNADIVVFPEMTLTRGNKVKVPIHGLLKEYPVPAEHPELYDEILVSLSTEARKYEIYVLVNVQEEMDCKDAPGEYCPDAKIYLFNTNVVFDRTGAVIDRYRKINLFGEYTRHPALQPDLGVFRTDFGVTFGHFICFDIMFQVPATQIVEKHKITDIIFSTMWFSEMPFLTAVQSQEAYAYTMNINLIAANANNIKVGTAGSGIYSGNAGALISTMSGTSSTKLLLARVPKKPGHVTYNYPGPIYDDPNKPDNLIIQKDLTLPSSVSRAIVQGFQEFTLSENGVSCRFQVKTKVTAPSGSTVPKFRAFVKDGTNTYAKRKIGVALCAIVACKDDTAVSCPYKFNNDEIYTEFQELDIKMTTYNYQHNSTLDCDNVVYYPTSLRHNKFPLHPQNFTFTKSSQNGAYYIQNGDFYTQDGGHYTQNGQCSRNNLNVSNERDNRQQVSMSLVEPQSELISFGIWGRIYIRDVNPLHGPTEEEVNNYIEIENIIYNHGEKHST